MQGIDLGQKLVNVVFDSDSSSLVNRSAKISDLLSWKKLRGTATENLSFAKFKAEIENCILRVMLIYDESITGSTAQALTKKEFTVLFQTVKLSAHAVKHLGDDCSGESQTAIQKLLNLLVDQIVHIRVAKSRSLTSSAYHHDLLAFMDVKTGMKLQKLMKEHP